MSALGFSVKPEFLPATSAFFRTGPARLLKQSIWGLGEAEFRKRCAARFTLLAG